MPNLAMRQPGTQFSADGLNVSWPNGGDREIVAVDDDKMSLRIRRRIAEGSIVITDEKANKVPGEGEREYRLLTGAEARRHFDEPAGPVTRVVYHPATPEDERDYQLEVQDASTNSQTFLDAQKARGEQSEKSHAEIGKRQVEAEKAAAKDAKDDEDEPDEIDARLQRTEEASAEWHADREKAFMERETERQKDENEMIEAQAKIKPVEEEADTSADEAFMEREKARQKVEADVEKERQKAAKAAEDAPIHDGGMAGKTDPYVGMSTAGRRPGVTITSADRMRTETTTKKSAPKATAKASPKAAPKAVSKSAAKAPKAAPKLSTKSADEIATTNLGGKSPSELAAGSETPTSDKT